MAGLHTHIKSVVEVLDFDALCSSSFQKMSQLPPAVLVSLGEEGFLKE